VKIPTQETKNSAFQTNNVAHLSKKEKNKKKRSTKNGIVDKIIGVTIQYPRAAPFKMYQVGPHVFKSPLFQDVLRPFVCV